MERWWPSGPAFGPGRLLNDLLAVACGVQDYETVILRNGAQRFHITSAHAVTQAAFSQGQIGFALDDPTSDQVQALISGVSEKAVPHADNAPLARAGFLATAAEGWTRIQARLPLIKLRRGTQPRVIRIQMP